MTSDSDLIWASIEAAMAVQEDLAPAIYRRMFASAPEAQRRFGLDAPPAHCEAGMAGMASEAILILAGQGEDHLSLEANLAPTLATHAGVGIDRAMYAALFDAIVETVREAAGPAWTSAMDEAWSARVTAVTAALTPAVVADEAWCRENLRLG